MKEAGIIGKLRRDRDSRVIAFYFLAAFVFGLILIRGYGVYWDYEDEVSILWWNMHEFAVNLCGENSWLAGKFSHLIVPSLEQEKDHGIAIYYPAAPFLYKAFGYWRYFVWRISVFIVFFLSALGIFFSAKTIYRSRKLACFLFSVYLFAPIPFAYGHLDNKDIGFLSMSVLTLLGALKWARCDMGGGKKQRIHRLKWILFFSLAAALAANCKILGILFWGMGVVYVMLYQLMRQGTSDGGSPPRNGKEWAGIFGKIILAAAAGFLLCFFVITPAAWRHPIDYAIFVIRSVFRFVRWGGMVKFAGTIYSEGETPWYYLGGMIVLTTPVFILLLILAGHLEVIRTAAASVMKKRGGAGQRVHTLNMIYLFLLWLIPFLYGSFGDDIIYDEWRHFFFLWGYLVLIGGAGALRLADFAEKIAGKIAGKLRPDASGTARRVPAWIGTACVLYLILLILTGHPYEYAYTNVFAGPNAGERYQIDYWQISFDSAMRRLCAMDEGERNTELELSVGGADYYFNGFAVDYTYRSLHPAFQQKIIPGGQDANYLFRSVTYDGIAQLVDLSGYHLLFTIRAYGNDIMGVWEKNQ